MHSVVKGSLFCLGRLCERRWLSSTPKLVTPLVTCSQRKVMRRLTRMLPSRLRLNDFFHFSSKTPRDASFTFSYLQIKMCFGLYIPVTFHK